MKRRIISVLLVLVMALTLLPTAAFATGEDVAAPAERQEPVCVCEAACTEEAMNADCPVCGAEGALPENCGKYAAPVNGEGSEAGTSAQALTSAAITFPAPKVEEKIRNSIDTATAQSDTGSLILHIALCALWEDGETSELMNGPVYERGRAYQLKFRFRTDASLDALSTVTCNGQSVMLLTGVEANEMAVQEKMRNRDGAQDTYYAFVNNGYEKTELWLFAYVHVPLATAEVSTAEELTAALADNANGTVKLTKDIDISNVLTVTRTVTLDLNGKVLRMTGSGSVIAVSNGNLTLTDSAPDAKHRFTPNTDGLWVLDETNGTETVTGGVITGGKASNGGGVYVAANVTFTMSGGSIVGCTASDSGGGVYIEGKGTFTMNGGTIQNCASGQYGGGGVHVCGNGSPIMYANGGTVSDCVSGDVNSEHNALFNHGFVKAEDGKPGTTFAGTVRNDGIIEGGIFNDAVKSSGTIEGGIFNGTVNGSGNITGGTFNDKVTRVFNPGWSSAPIEITGLGTEAYLYEIGTADQLKLFRDIVNGDNGQTRNTAAHAKLMNDIVLGGDEWTPIGYASDYDEMKAYSGTFDGQGHTISGLYADAAVSGLFGYTKNAAIKNLTVAGSVGGGNCSTAGGGIVGYAVGGAIENCGNLCAVIARGSCPGGGIVGFASNLTVTGCYNAGRVFKPDGSSGGGIVGKGKNVNIYDCYNVGEVEGYRGQRGGIVGEASGSVFVYNCYNTGNIIEAGGTGDANETVRGIVGGGVGPVTIQNCYYLEGTRADTGATVQTAAQFADGTVLAALKAGSRTGTDPWADACKYLAAAGRTLPVFKTQTGDDHTHTWTAWTHVEGTDTHTRSCTSCQAVEKDPHDWDSGKVTKQSTCMTAGVKTFTCDECGATKDDSIPATGHSWKQEWKSDATHHWHECANKNCDVKVDSGKDGYAEHSGGTATCTAKAVCATCNQPYGALNSTNHDWNEWKFNGDDTHTRVCKRDASHKQTVACSGGTATCTDKAVCTVCKSEYGGLAPDNHSDLRHVKAKDATTSAEGNIEYWYCADCSKYYKDAAATKEIGKKDTVTPRKTGVTANPVKNPYQKDDGKKTDGKTIQSGKTGDPGVALYAAMALLSLTGGAWTVGRKRR